MDADYDWYMKHDFSEYAGQWVAIYNQSIIASSKNFIEAINKAKERVKSPLMAKIPEKKIHLLQLC